MFCPNCGKDCGNTRFCSNCGTQLQNAAQEKQNPIWSVGMACPHCGGTRIEGKCCAFCGAQLILDMPQEKSGGDREEDSYEIPYGVYKGVTSSIALYEKDFVIENRILFKKHSTRIPYDQITTVIYVRPEDKFISNGYLIVRWKGNIDLPIPVGNNRSTDITSVTITDISDLLFYHIFYFLKTMAPNIAEFSVQVEKQNTDDLNKTEYDLNLDFYFEEFSPHRELATKALVERTGVSSKKAKILIDHHFDEKQRIQYNANPTIAIRDLNRVLEEQRRQDELRAQALKESQERRDREQMQHHLDQLEKERRQELRDRWRK